ncbi:MAG: SPOR domain-containing protein [Nitrospinota bacterium]
MRRIFFVILILLTATGVYFKEDLGLEIFGIGEKKVVTKKVRAVKPKSLINKADALKPVSNQFTFFETLEDKTMTKYVGLHGEILPVSLPAQPFQEKIKLSKKPEKPKLKTKTPDIQKEEKPSSKASSPRFAVQVSSFRNEKMAGALKLKLQKIGFDAFLMETELPNHGGKWYRVFLGRYSDEGLARKEAERVRQEYKLNAVVVKKTMG